jgi:general secretion pathway protein D
VRQNASQGTVRIPAGYTVVLGGLASTRDEQVKDGIPLLSDLPILGSVFSNLASGQVKETLFIFIRPVLLRDLAFRDLRFLSEEDARKAQIARHEYPENPLKVFSLAAESQTRGN